MQKIIFRARNKVNKNSVKDAPKNKKKKKSTAVEKELDDLSKAGNDAADEDVKDANQEKGNNKGRNREEEGVEVVEKNEEVVERDSEVRREEGSQLDREERAAEGRQDRSWGRKGIDSVSTVTNQEMGNEEVVSDLNAEMKVETGQRDLPEGGRTGQEPPPSAEESELPADSDI